MKIADVDGARAHLGLSEKSQMAYYAIAGIPLTASKVTVEEKLRDWGWPVQVVTKRQVDGVVEVVVKSEATPSTTTPTIGGAGLTIKPTTRPPVHCTVQRCTYQAPGAPSTVLPQPHLRFPAPAVAAVPVPAPTPASAHTSTSAAARGTDGYLMAAKGRGTAPAPQQNDLAVQNAHLEAQVATLTAQGKGAKGAKGKGGKGGIVAERKEEGELNSGPTPQPETLHFPAHSQAIAVLRAENATLTDELKKLTSLVHYLQVQLQQQQQQQYTQQQSPPVPQSSPTPAPQKTNPKTTEEQPGKFVKGLDATKARANHENAALKQQQTIREQLRDEKRKTAVHTTPQKGAHASPARTSKSKQVGGESPQPASPRKQ